MGSNIVCVYGIWQLVVVVVVVVVVASGVQCESPIKTMAVIVSIISCPQDRTQ